MKKKTVLVRLSTGSPADPDLLREVPVASEETLPILGRVCYHHEVYHFGDPRKAWVATHAETGDRISGRAWPSRQVCIEETHKRLARIPDAEKAEILAFRRKVLTKKETLPWSPPSP